MPPTTCPDSRANLCQCIECFHGGCCLRAEHIGIMCPILDCPDFRPPPAKKPTPPQKTAAQTQQPQQLKPICRTAEEAFAVMARIYGPEWRHSYIPKADEK